MLTTSNGMPWIWVKFYYRCLSERAPGRIILHAHLTSRQKFSGLSESVSAYDDFQVLSQRYTGKKVPGKSTPERTASWAQGGANRKEYLSSVWFQLSYPIGSQQLTHILCVLTHPYFTQSIPGLIDHINASFQNFLFGSLISPLEYLLLKRHL